MHIYMLYTADQININQKAIPHSSSDMLESQIEPPILNRNWKAFTCLKSNSKLKDSRTKQSHPNTPAHP